MALPELYLGVDAGSTAIKALAIAADGQAVATHLAPVSGDYAADIERIHKGGRIASLLGPLCSRSSVGSEKRRGGENGSFFKIFENF